VFVGGTFWTQPLTASATLNQIAQTDDGKGLYVVAKSENTTAKYESPKASVAILGKRLRRLHLSLYYVLVVDVKFTIGHSHSLNFFIRS
jgi:hypothetical protein